ncbi:hypothetical protein ACFYT3_26215 [Nocardia amikacinitolerans]|uniref:hypothetical protein n=1 Tax=Nocardia amikacinitolerans TaxID=756689 RepID=UPI0020A5A651|nr:hypothetical protein [Nocardia amikacinitolerans]MCP2289673.1 hypothetical protein [Nocardia amikacinitolerans]
MPAQRRTYLVRLDPAHPAEAAGGNRAKLFDWLETASAEVVQLCGADRVVVSCAGVLADELRALDYVLDVEPHEPPV